MDFVIHCMIFYIYNSVRLSLYAWQKWYFYLFYQEDILEEEDEELDDVEKAAKAIVDLSMYITTQVPKFYTMNVLSDSKI